MAAAWCTTWEAFSSRVMRETRSSTRWSVGNSGFRYAGDEVWSGDDCCAAMGRKGKVAIDATIRTQLKNDRRERTKATSRCVTRDRKSTRLNSSHSQISYAVFCLKQTHII